MRKKDSWMILAKICSKDNVKKDTHCKYYLQGKCNHGAKDKDVHILIQNFALIFSKRVPQDVTNQIMNTPIQICEVLSFGQNVQAEEDSEQK